MVGIEQGVLYYASNALGHGWSNEPAVDSTDHGTLINAGEGELQKSSSGEPAAVTGNI